MPGKYAAHHPPLVDKPGENWVSRAGGLPGPIDAVARALVAKGWPTSRAIATGVNHVKKVCLTGRAIGGSVEVSSEARAQACAAVARWEAMKVAAKAKRVASLSGEAVELAAIPRTGKVQKKIQVRNAKGTVYTRTIWANPEQIARAKADRVKRVKGEAGPLVKTPGGTATHAQAGLRRLGKNVYVDGKGKTFKRVGEGKSSTFAPLSAKEAKVVKKVVRRAVARRDGRIATVPVRKSSKGNSSPLTARETKALAKAVRRVGAKRGKR